MIEQLMGCFYKEECMKKSISKVLTLMLSFAMVFTSIGWIGASEVNAESSTIRIKVVDQNDNVVNNVYLSVKPYTDDAYFEASPTDTDGVYDYCIEEDSLDVFDPDEEYELPLLVSDASSETVEYIATDPEVKVTVKNGLFLKVGNDPYDGTTTITLKVKDDDPMEGWTEKFDFNTDTTYDWASYGVDYTSIDFDKDLIVDVRSIDFSKEQHFVFSDPDAVDVTKAEIAAGDAVAQKLDAALTKAKGANKKVVLICYGGMKYAKRAMQYYNTKGETLGPNGNVTYLKGGANGVTGSDYKANLGIGFDDIASNDVILDVRSKENFDKGHLPGAVHVDVTDEDGKLSSKDKSDMAAALAKVPNGAKLVIVCNSGKSLAYKAMAYFMADKSASGLENLKKVSYLIGGDTVIPADKKVTTEEENTPAPAPAAPAVTDGQTATVGGNTYKVTSASAKTAAFTKAKKSKKSATVPVTVTVNGVKLNVTSIAPKAFKGTKVKTLTVKSKKLTKGSVKGSLKGSKVKTVKVKVGKKKENKKYVKKYKKIFTKKNCGKKVKVK